MIEIFKNLALLLKVILMAFVKIVWELLKRK